MNREYAIVPDDAMLASDMAGWMLPLWAHLKGPAERHRKRVEGGADDLEHELRQAGGLEGRPTGRHLVQNAAQRPDVRGVGVRPGGNDLCGKQDIT